VGVPLLYAVLLRASSDAVLNQSKGAATALSLSTRFLWADYSEPAFWWEPIEMCRKLALTGWVLVIDERYGMLRVLVALLISTLFLTLRLTVKPLKRNDDRALMTFTELSLIMLYMAVLVIKACNVSEDYCILFGFGHDANGAFLFLLFSGLSIMLIQLIFEIVSFMLSVRQEMLARRVRFLGSGQMVELAPRTKADFAHLPGLEPSECYHLFLSHAWPLGQDVCKLVKQRCREICPSMQVFLDVEDLASGSGTKEVDHSHCIFIFAMPVYFEKVNCIKEMFRALVRKKDVSLLLPDAEVHGAFTQAMIRDIVTDSWVKKCGVQKKVHEWGSSWGVPDMKLPSPDEILETLFKRPPLEWSRITAFQDRTMLSICQRALPDETQRLYMPGSESFALPKGHVATRMYCSPHNLGAHELAEELNDTFATERSTKKMPSLPSLPSLQSMRAIRNPMSRRSSSRVPGANESSTAVGMQLGSRLITIVDEVNQLGECSHMLLYLNGATWTHAPGELSSDIQKAQSLGVHLQLCHEFPSVIDTGSARNALEFKKIMHATPEELKQGDCNVYRQIAIALKGGDLRDVGLSNLAALLVQPVEDTSKLSSFAMYRKIGSSKDLRSTASGAAPAIKTEDTPDTSRLVTPPTLDVI